MKRLTCLILVLALALCLCACGGGKDDPSGPDQPDMPNTINPFALWDSIRGVWVRDKDGTKDFLCFGDEGADLSISYGIFFSEFAEGGALQSAVRKDGTYELGIHVAEIPASEEYDGREEHDLVFRVDTDKLGDGILYATDHAADGKMYEFEYLAPSWDEIDWNDLYYNEINADEVWKLLDGVWTAKDGDEVFFMIFEKENGKKCVFTGIPFSGYGLYGEALDIKGNSGERILVCDVFIPGHPETVESSATEDMTYQLYVYYSQVGDGIIYATNFAGSGDTLKFDYACATLDDLDFGFLEEAYGW